MKKIILSVFVVLLVFTLSAVCNSSASGAEYTFTIGLTGDIAGLEPGLAYDPNTIPVLSQITDNLVKRTPDGGLEPQLAKEIETPDDTTYIYKLRDDVTFSDGAPLTADDVVWSLQRYADPNGGALQQWNYENVLSIEKTGGLEVTVKLKQPSNTWKHVAATNPSYISSKKHFEETGEHIGTGAYVFESRVNGQEIVLKKRGDYWNGDISEAPGKLIYKIVPDSTTLVTALKNGEIDYAPVPPADLLGELIAAPSLKVSNYPDRAITFVAFNTGRGPTSDVNVRRAIYSAIDIDEFVVNVVGNLGSVTTGIPNSPALYGEHPDQWQKFSDSAIKYPYDIGKAKEYLAQSAYPDGFTANVVVNQNPRYNDIGLYLQENLKPLGINIEILKVTGEEHDEYYFGNILDADGKRGYDLLVGSWWPNNDVGGILEPLYQSGNSSNVAAYGNAAADALIREEMTILDETARNAKIFEALNIILPDAPYIYVLYPNAQNVINAKFTTPPIDSTPASDALRYVDVRLAK
ncbi:MAG: ABC transporter substrate-binding protein [Synergistaceae bacterium]|jgi:peptide/nickel transport system substrate-binding protein|nr:ABC transporter substrate-binding protein [Synergistaceae bacterium]